MSMTKLIFSDAYDSTVDVGMRITEDPAVMKKQASTVFGCDYADVMPDKDHVGIHVVALGDTEHFGLNRNSDGFKRAACERYHDTFVKHGHVFRHHCLDAGSLVLMGDLSYRRIETVVAGEYVYTHTGAIKRVVQVFKNPAVTELLSFAIRGTMDRLTCTDEHPVAVIRGDSTVCRSKGLNSPNRCYPRSLHSYAYCEGCTRTPAHFEMEWMPAKYVRLGDYVLVPRIQYGTETIDDDTAYFYGLFAAEGGFTHVAKASHMLTLTLGSHEADLIAFVIQYLTKAGVKFRGPYIRKDQHTATVQITDKVFSARITEFFGGKTYSHERRVTSAIMHASASARSAFLSGYMDGDGCWQNDALRGRSTSFTLLRQLALIAGSLGILSAVVADVRSGIMTCRLPYQGKQYKYKASGCVAIYSGQLTKLLSRCRKLGGITIQDVEAIRKSSSIFATDRYICYPVLEIDRVAATDGNVYNLEVEDDNSFVVGNLAVHNCNRPDSPRLGTIVKSAYNAPMGRIELFIHAHKEAARDELDKLAKVGEIPHSMACVVPGDYCTICDTFRKNAADPNQCEHIREHLGETWDDGRKVGMDNRDPKFFDISFVTRPADRIAWSLKTAGTGIVDSIQLAKEAELWVPDTVAIDSKQGLEKLALLRKLAHHEAAYLQHLAGTAMDPYRWELRKAATQLPGTVIDELRRFDPDDVFCALAQSGVVLGPQDFFKYALGPEYSKVEPFMPGVMLKLAGQYSRAIQQGRCQELCNDGTYDVKPSIDLPCKLASLVLGSVKPAGTLVGDDVGRRIIDSTLMGLPVKFAVDISTKMQFNDLNTAGALADKYAAYKLAGIHAVLHWNTKSDENSVLALAAAQNMFV